MFNIDENIVRRNKIINKVVKVLLMLITILASSIILVIVWQVTKNGLKPFFTSYDGLKVNFFNFLGGTSYNETNYQIGFIIINTIYVVLLAVLVSVPISVLTALFIVKIAPKKVDKLMTTVIEVLASIPSIIFGVFGAGYITKLVKGLADTFGIASAGGISVLASVIVLTMMIIPTITMLSVTAIRAVPQSLEEGSLALGSSRMQTFFNVTIKSAVPGIFAGIILGVGRALGEATAVSMVAGNLSSGPSFNLFDATRTLTSTILIGLKETDGLDYDIRFSVGLVLIFVILVVNYILNTIKKRISAKYES